MGPSASSINCLLPRAADQYLLPPRGHSPGGPGWAPPSLDSAHCSRLQRCWHFPAPCWALKGAASEACSEAGQAAPVCSDPAGLPQPHTTPCTHTPSPGRGHTGPQLGPLLWLRVSQNFHSCFRTLLPLVGMLNVSPSGVLEAGPCHPYQYLPLPVHALASPPTRCLGGLCPLRDPGAQDGTLWS